ncbi:MAG: PP2C family protein-serine/threonine phosphatase [Phycisphaerales bacterium]
MGGTARGQDMKSSVREVDLRGRLVLDDYVETLRAMSAIVEPKEIQRLFSESARRINSAQGYIAVSKRNLGAGQYKITRRLLTEEDLERTNYNPWGAWNDMPTYTGGLIGELIAEARPRLLLDMRIPHDPVLGDALAGFRSLAAVPLFDDGEDLNWSIMVNPAADGITPEQVEDFFMRANLGGRMTKGLIDKRRVEALLAERQRQLLDIANIQRSLLPEGVPRIAGVPIATSYLPCNESGGDYYDFFEFGDGRMGVFIADVSGHGAGAATLMAMLQTILHEAHRLGRDSEPAEVMAHANEALSRRRIDGAFITAFLGVLSDDRRTLTYANAGHNRPLLRRGAGAGSGRVSAIEGGLSFPLGVLPETRFEQAEMELVSGDSIVMYTDGITEARSAPPDREMFGEDRLRSALEDCSGDPECVIESIHARLYEHTHARSREDDQTIVALRVAR